MEAYKIYPFINKDNSLNENLYNDKGVLLLRKGMKLSNEHIRMIQKHQLKRINELNIVDPVPKNYKSIKKYYKSNVANVKEFFQNVVQVNPNSAKDLIESFRPLMQNLMNDSSIMTGMYGLKNFDEYTFKHSVNVGILCGLIGKILNYSDESILKLGEMGLLHDIGKMRVSLDILNKPGRLTMAEYEEVKKHTVYGYKMLKNVEGVTEETKIGALLHHESLDGTGYPLNKKKEEIPYFVQILSVADTFDAICSKRVYSDKQPPIYALEELLKDAFKNKLNAEIVIPFAQFVMEQQINEEVELSDGRIGKIVFFYEDEPSRPIVQIDDELVSLKLQRQLHVVSMIIKEEDDEID